MPSDRPDPLPAAPPMVGLFGARLGAAGEPVLCDGRARAPAPEAAEWPQRFKESLATR